MNLRPRENRDDKGFTLIELMVVVLIIGVLLAIAIPTFLGARQRAEDRAAQSSLRNALSAAQVIYTDNSTYVTADRANLLLAEPSLTFAATAATVSAGPKDISVATGTVDTWAGAVKSKSGKCFFIKINAIAIGVVPAGTYYGTLPAPGAACTGTQALASATLAKW